MTGGWQLRAMPVLAVLLLAAVFALGGGARGDIVSLDVLRPLTLLVLAAGLATLQLKQIRHYRGLFTIAALMIGWSLLQMVPLPPQIWHSLQSHTFVAKLDVLTGNEGAWRPIAVSASGAQNALWSFAAPLSMLVIGAQLGPAALHKLVFPVLVIIGCSACLGIAQLGGDPHGPLFPYAVTNNGSLVGLFANHNHHALLLATAIPLGAAYFVGKTDLSSRQVAIRSALIAGIAGALLLVCGSRSGLLLGCIATAFLPLLLQTGKTTSKARGMLMSAGALFCILTFLVVIPGRSPALDRILNTSPAAELRVEALPTMLQMARNALPFGLGQGSFERAYMIYEPDNLLGPLYLNHAHNDWLEAVITGGIPVALLVLCSATAVLWFGVKLIRAPLGRNAAVLHGRLGMIVLVLVGLASLVDYPLRVPSLACLATLAALWLADGAINPFAVDRTGQMTMMEQA